MPGGSKFEKEEIIAALKRLPLFLVLAGLVTYEDTTPLKFEKAFGPSMLPTIHPLGDCFLRATGAWHRALGKTIDYKVGDVVAIANSNGHGLNCKRIVGVQGDKVLRYGQFVELYKDRADFGILPPRQESGYNLSWEDDYVPDNVEKDIARVLVVPPSHVWVEGDNPLFSVDSRHYGPIPVESIWGKLLMRIWPLWRYERVRPSPAIISRERPLPLTMYEALAVHRYNLYKKSVPGADEKPEWS
jgi:signal peptidase I